MLYRHSPGQIQGKSRKISGKITVYLLEIRTRILLRKKDSAKPIPRPHLTTTAYKYFSPVTSRMKRLWIKVVWYIYF